MTDPQTTLTAEQRQVLSYLPQDGGFVEMPFEKDLPPGTAWVGGIRLFERCVWDDKKFRLASLGLRLKATADV